MASNGTSDGPRRRQGSHSQGIINLSPLGGKRTFHPTTSPPSCQDDDAINMGKKVGIIKSFMNFEHCHNLNCGSHLFTG